MSEVDVYPQVDESFIRNRVESRYAFTFFPKICFLTGKIIWLKVAYKETAMWTGPGDPVFETNWYDKDAYLIAKLRGFV